MARLFLRPFGQMKRNGPPSANQGLSVVTARSSHVILPRCWNPSSLPDPPFLLVRNLSAGARLHDGIMPRCIGIIMNLLWAIYPSLIPLLTYQRWVLLAYHIAGKYGRIFGLAICWSAEKSPN